MILLYDNRSTLYYCSMIPKKDKTLYRMHHKCIYRSSSKSEFPSKVNVPNIIQVPSLLEKKKLYKLLGLKGSIDAVVLCNIIVSRSFAVVVVFCSFACFVLS